MVFVLLVLVFCRCLTLVVCYCTVSFLGMVCDWCLVGFGYSLLVFVLLDGFCLDWFACVGCVVCYELLWLGGGYGSVLRCVLGVCVFALVWWCW